MLRPVILHKFRHVLVQPVLVLLGLHIDEIDDDDSAHIPEPELSGNLLRRITVHLVGVFLLVCSLCADTAVHVDDVKSFRRFYHQVGSLLDRHHLSERTLHLTRHLEMVENRLLSIVELHDLLLLR